MVGPNGAVAHPMKNIETMTMSVKVMHLVFFFIKLPFMLLAWRSNQPPRSKLSRYEMNGIIAASCRELTLVPQQRD